MGGDKDKKQKEKQGEVTPRRQEIYDYSGTLRNQAFTQPTQTETELTPLSQTFANAYQGALGQQTQDYSNIMGGYGDWMKSTANPLAQSINAHKAPNFTFQQVTAPRASGESLEGYRTFANTGGYSDADIQDIRARGISPIRAAYANTMSELDRARSLGGGYAPNYIAAISRAQRELPEQLATATTGVNAQLADAIRQGKLSGLAGMTGITENEAGRKLQADTSNQAMDLRTQELTEQGYNSQVARQLAAAEMGLKGLEGQRSIYGTSPGMASTFGNQALQAYGQRQQAEATRNSFGLGLMDTQLRSLGGQEPTEPGTPWWKTALSVAATAAPYVAMAMSSKKLKTDIEPLEDKDINKGLKKLQLYRWKYKGDDTTHMGPMAEDFTKSFGVGDGKSIHLADVMGVILASQRAEGKRRHV